MSVPDGADKKLRAKQEKRELERKNARRKHLWEQVDSVPDTFHGLLTETHRCKRSECFATWTQQFNSAFGGGRLIRGRDEPIGCFSPDR